MAMSYGLAIITSDVDSFKEVIRHGENGLMFKSLDEEDLSDKINSLLNDSEMLSQLQARSFEIDRYRIFMEQYRITIQKNT